MGDVLDTQERVQLRGLDWTCNEQSAGRREVKDGNAMGMDFVAATQTANAKCQAQRVTFRVIQQSTDSYIVYNHWHY